MKDNKLLLIGVSFILAIFVAIIGGVMIETEVNKMLDGESFSKTLIVVGMILELINVICVIIIGSLFREFFQNDKIANHYQITRIIEALVALSAILVAFSFLINSDVDSFGEAYEIRSFILNKGLPLMFSITAVILYYGVDKVKFVPKYLVIWGYIGALGIMLLNYTPIPESIGMLFALPIITNELYLGGYLIYMNQKQKKKSE